MTHINADRHDHQEDTRNSPDAHHTDPNQLRETVDQLRHRINRLEIILAATRRVYADLLAAARAAVAADRDGEADPLFYLRDELSQPHPPVPHARPDVPDSDVPDSTVPEGTTVHGGGR